MSFRFGAVDAAAALVTGTTSKSVNAMPEAAAVLDITRLPMPVDYFGGLVIAARQRGDEFLRFTGSVVSADPDGSRVAVKALSAVSLAESLIGAMVSRGVPGYELIHLLTRTGGMRDEMLNIQGLEALPRETFEIVVPLDGIAVDEPVDFAGVRFLPAERAVRAIASLDVKDDLREQFEAPAYCLALVTAERCLDAEERGLAAIALALSWATVRLRYGLALLPDGRVLPFRRSESLSTPTRRDLVAVRALATTRQWLRQPTSVAERRTAQLALGDARLDPELPRITLQERLAILALARAANEADALAAVQALFEAIEFYVHGVSLPHLFSKAELRKIKSSVAERLTVEQEDRFGHLLGGLNNAPLLERLRRAIDEDAVPIVPSEIDLLWRIRLLRNNVVHGRSSELPQSEDVEYATSIVARILIYRMARRASEQ